MADLFLPDLRDYDLRLDDFRALDVFRVLDDFDDLRPDDFFVPARVLLDFVVLLVVLLVVFFVVLRPDLVAFLVDAFAAFLPAFFFGTFAPSARASDRPIAIACLRLLTFLPEPPLFSVPALRFFIARPTLADAFLEYFRAMISSLWNDDQ
ncbi:hypothetical protein [Rhodopseudomonas palustris]|uniref:hypothetical protein n=1 Tax=Rhodopseudomonas palustris TaxID=1076 RepID=UPI00131A9F2E